MPDNTLALHLQVNMGQWESSLNKAGNSVSRLGSTGSQTLGRLSTLFLGLQTLPPLFNSLAGKVTEVDTKIRDLATITLDKSFAQVNTEARNFLGTMREMPIANAEILSGMYQWQSAGRDIKNIGEVAKYAKGGLTDLKTSVDLVSSIMNAYSMSNKEVVTVTDKLSMTAALGKTRASELGQALGMVATDAALAKVPLETLLASIASMTNVGLDTQRAVTYMRGAIQSLMAPEEGAAKKLRELGVTATDFEGKLKQLAAVSKDFTPDMWKQIVPEREAATGVKSLVSQYEQLIAMRDKIGKESTGMTAKNAQVQMESIDNQIILLKKEFTNLTETLGAGLVPILKNLNQSFSRIGELAHSNNQAISETGIEMLGVYLISSKTLQAMQGWNAVSKTLFKIDTKAIKALFTEGGASLAEFAAKLDATHLSFKQLGTAGVNSLKNIANASIGTAAGLGVILVAAGAALYLFNKYASEAEAAIKKQNEATSSGAKQVAKMAEAMKFAAENSQKYLSAAESHARIDKDRTTEIKNVSHAIEGLEAKEALMYNAGIKKGDERIQSIHREKAKLNEYKKELEGMNDTDFSSRLISQVESVTVSLDEFNKLVRDVKSELAKGMDLDIRVNMPDLGQVTTQLDQYAKGQSGRMPSMDLGMASPNINLPGIANIDVATETKEKTEKDKKPPSKGSSRKPAEDTSVGGPSGGSVQTKTIEEWEKLSNVLELAKAELAEYTEGSQEYDNVMQNKVIPAEKALRAELDSRIAKLRETSNLTTEEKDKMFESYTQRQDVIALFGKKWEAMNDEERARVRLHWEEMNKEEIADQQEKITKLTEYLNKRNALTMQKQYEQKTAEEAFRAEMSAMDTTWSERSFSSLQEDISARTARLNKLNELGVINETENMKQLSELSVMNEQAAYLARAEIASQGDMSEEKRRIMSLKFEQDYWNRRQEQLVEALNKGLITKEQYAKAEAEIDKKQSATKIQLEKAIDTQRQTRARQAADALLKIGNVGQEMARASTIKDMHERRRAQGEILKKEAIDAITSAETAGVAKIMSTHALMLPVGIAKAAVFIASMEVLKFGISQIGAAKGVIADRPMLTWIAEYEPELVVPKRLLDANRMPGGSPIDNIFNNQFGNSQQFHLNTEVHIHNPIGDAGATLANALESWEEQVGPALKRILQKN